MIKEIYYIQHDIFASHPMKRLFLSQARQQ